MAVITISRQMGSLGRQVGEEIGRCLNYRVVMREVINEAASRAGVPEVALATIDELDLLGLRPTAAARNAYHAAVREIMVELAREGNVVIVGRAGQVILRGRPDVLHVRIYAPLELRVERIAKQRYVSPKAARAQVLASDKARTLYLKRYYQSRWDDPDLYDVMVNTEHLGMHDAALVVCEALKHFNHAGGSEIGHA
jgi:cytidylate kinase